MSTGRRAVRRTPASSAAVAADATAAVSRTAAGILVRLAVLCLVVASVAAVTGWDLERDEARLVAAPRVDLRTLPASTTHARIPRAARFTATPPARAGAVVHPVRPVAVFARPGERAFAKVKPTTLTETWLPVVDKRPGWTRVLLPSRPNGSAGWISDAHLERRRTPYAVRVHLGSRTMELLHEGRTVGSWTVAIGAPGTPTPTGLTFVHALIQDPGQSYSPYLLPLGSHSDTLDTYGGGPGTVAFHTWPDSSVYGRAVSHGCIRVPADALDRLTNVPLGTQVSIDNQ